MNEIICAVLITIMSTLWLVMLWAESKKIKDPCYYRTQERSFGHTIGFSSLNSMNISFGTDSEEFKDLLTKMANNIEEETFKKMPTNIHVEGQDAYAYSFTGHLNNPVCPDFNAKED